MANAVQRRNRRRAQLDLQFKTFASVSALALVDAIVVGGRKRSQKRRVVELLRSAQAVHA